MAFYSKLAFEWVSHTVRLWLELKVRYCRMCADLGQTDGSRETPPADSAPDTGVAVCGLWMPGADSATSCSTRAARIRSNPSQHVGSFSVQHSSKTAARVRYTCCNARHVRSAFDRG